MYMCIVSLHRDVEDQLDAWRAEQVDITDRLSRKLIVITEEAEKEFERVNADTRQITQGNADSPLSRIIY